MIRKRSAPSRFPADKESPAAPENLPPQVPLSAPSGRSGGRAIGRGSSFTSVMRERTGRKKRSRCIFRRDLMRFAGGIIYPFFSYDLMILSSVFVMIFSLFVSVEATSVDPAVRRSRTN